jgi:hypothetical protein
MARVVNATSRVAYSRQRSRYPLHTRKGGPQGRAAGVQKHSLPPGFDPQTVSLCRLSYPGPMKADQFRLYRLLSAAETEAINSQWGKSAATNY